MKSLKMLPGGGMNARTLVLSLTLAGTFGLFAETVAGIADGVLTLTGGEVTVNVPSGETVTVTSYTESEAGAGSTSDIVKTGAGTLVLPTGSATSYRKLVAQGGFVNVSAESCFGAEGVSLEDGGALRFTGSFGQSRARITCTGSVTLDVPENITLGIHSNYFVSTGATVTKTGTGIWKLNTTFRTDGIPPVDHTGSKWVVHEGKLKLASNDVFCSATGWCPLVLEAHEDAVIELENFGTHTPICELVLRGGTVYAGRAQFSTKDKLESGAVWKGVGLKGPIKVLASDRPSRIIARHTHLAHGSGKRTIFDVETGVTLEVDAVLQPGYNCPGMGFVKRGGGTLKLFKTVGASGVIDVEGGTFELADGVKLAENVSLNMNAGAKLVLGDGAQVAVPATGCSELLHSAEVWFDASVINQADGTSVSSVPNRGMCGGKFEVANGDKGYSPEAPKFVKDGINGLGCVNFDGSQDLLTKAYTNRGEQATVFLVSKWTSWSATGGQGKWGGPLSIIAAPPQQHPGGNDDNHAYGGIAYQNGSSEALNKALSTYSGDANAPTLSNVPSVNVPYLTHSGRNVNTKKIFTEVFWAGGYQAGTNTVAGMVNCDMDTVCVGSRLKTNGKPIIYGMTNTANRAYIGQIGEVLIYSRALTAEEESKVLAYLKNKWFNVGELDLAAKRECANEVKVEVPSGTATAVLGTTGSTAIEKLGAGSLTIGGSANAFVDVKEGAIAFEKGHAKSMVDVWVDASSSEGMTFDGDGRVTNLVNRGTCGGSFVRNTCAANVPAGAEWSDDGAAEHSINGRPALVFDGDSGLALFSYTNYTSPRSVSIYCIAERTRWELSNLHENGGGLGKWAGPCQLGDVRATKSDENVPGVITLQESTINGVGLDIGNTYLTGAVPPPTGEPYFMVIHSYTNGYLHAYETNATKVADVPRNASNAMDCEPLAVNVVQLAARTRAGGGAQWWGKGNASNRMWYGKIGEFIVTTEPLGEEHEKELFAYLRKKWLNKGEGSTTPPAWMTGRAITPATDGGTVLSMADGTSLVHGADALQLGAIETEGTVNWTRLWDSAAGENALAMFDVTGDVNLGEIALGLYPMTTSGKLLSFGGAASGLMKWSVSGENGVTTASVSKRSDGFWLSRSGTILFIR